MSSWNSQYILKGCSVSFFIVYHLHWLPSEPLCPVQLYVNFWIQALFLSDASYLLSAMARNTDLKSDPSLFSFWFLFKAHGKALGWQLWRLQTCLSVCHVQPGTSLCISSSPPLCTCGKSAWGKRQAALSLVLLWKGKQLARIQGQALSVFYNTYLLQPSPIHIHTHSFIHKVPNWLIWTGAWILC